MANLSGNSLFAGIYSGLTNTYSYLAQINPNGVTQDSINKARTDAKNSLNLNQSFASYLQSNFKNIDVDGDGIIGSNEITDYTNTLSTEGLTREQLTQLAATGMSGLSSDSLNEILENFEDIDANHDGKITTAEISAYKYSSSKQEKMDEYNHKKATDMSTFYGSDSSASDISSYSMLSYRYKKNS